MRVGAGKLVAGGDALRDILQRERVPRGHNGLAAPEEIWARPADQILERLGEQHRQEEGLGNTGRAGGREGGRAGKASIIARITPEGGQLAAACAFPTIPSAPPARTDLHTVKEKIHRGGHGVGEGAVRAARRHQLAHRHGQRQHDQRDQHRHPGRDSVVVWVVELRSQGSSGSC